MKKVSKRADKRRNLKMQLVPKWNKLDRNATKRLTARFKMDEIIAVAYLVNSKRASFFLHLDYVKPPGVRLFSRGTCYKRTSEIVYSPNLEQSKT